MRFLKKKQKKIYRFKLEATIDVIAASERHGKRRVNIFLNQGELRRAFLVK